MRQTALAWLANCRPYNKWGFSSKALGTRSSYAYWGMSKYWTRLFVTLVLAGGLSSGANADGYEYEPVGKGFAPPPEVWSWTGFYLGGHVGYAWPGVDGFFDASNVSHSLSVLNIDGSFGGGQIGYNYQIQQFVVGIEGDYSHLNNSDSATFVDVGGFDDTVRAEIDYLASIRARLGWAWQNILLYGTVGWGWTEYEFSMLDTNGNFGKISFNENGVVWGGGLEVGLTKAVLVRAEYLRYDVGTSSTVKSIPDCNFSPDCLVKFDNVDVVRGALNVKLY